MYNFVPSNYTLEEAVKYCNVDVTEVMDLVDNEIEDVRQQCLDLFIDLETEVTANVTEFMGEGCTDFILDNLYEYDTMLKNELVDACEHVTTAADEFDTQSTNALEYINEEFSNVKKELSNG